MTGGQDTRGHSTLDERRKLKQAKGIGDLRTGPGNTTSQFFLRTLEVLEKLLIGGGFFERVELCTVKILKERISQEILVGGPANNRGDALATSSLGCPQAPLTHEEFISRIRELSEGF